MVDFRVLTVKSTLVEKCLRKAVTKAGDSLEEFLRDEDRQDLVILNLMNAIQGCINIASHVVMDRRLGVPGNTGEIFYLLYDAGLLSSEVTDAMRGAVSFRNLCAHQYGDIDLSRVYEIATTKTEDIERFLRETFTNIS